MQLLANTELQDGKYRIIRVLGQGGFGITYLVENMFLGKLVAVKEFFPKDFCGRDSTSRLTLGTQNNAETVEKLKARFLKEAKNIAKLDHPGIVKIHDIFEENNTAYYVMDYIEGENLNEMVKRGGALSERKALDYIRKVGDALDYVHSRNMTHFDVKPANIVVRHSDNQPILVDFGLSKQYDMHGDATSTLMQGVSHGYSPIELYNPGSLKTFSPETDVYSLGATLYFLLTQVTPPAASEVAESGLTFPPTISDSTKAAIESAMKLSRAQRPKQITMFVESLSGKKPGCAPASVNEDTVIIGTTPQSKPASSANGGVSSAKPKSPRKPASRPKRPSNNSNKKKPRIIFGIVLSVVLILVGGGVYFYKTQGATIVDGKYIYKDGIEYKIASANSRELIVIYGDGLDGEVRLPERILANRKFFTVVAIGDSAFCKNIGGIVRGKNFTRINIPNSVTSIGKRAFAHCDSLEAINIPSSVTSIGEGAFAHCSELTHIDIPNSVTSIGKHVFYNSGLTTINIPNSVTSIGEGAFAGCSKLAHIDIPNSVTTLGNEVFKDSGLMTINIPNSVTSIGVCAFAHCSKLIHIDIPNSITTVQPSAIAGKA